ncbi:unnamed protein product (macronuclear) [Paramecium tetraurelia]|uniref:PHR domain-containing protein n=1 Tax=Paramecium tetraurelia TaxID=5888 RepID=A0DA44_PARTE|nr:uncharacterized protein GSPATT00039361001 [Paramecium tetraurelia]CAK79911.1 unnamed protein product [Paramecium tetraurelia]|eukprot:XP_001447308.1 hypothetical protein (macronuclear) [Paramecium tetraurelia strain d4-2]
MLKKNDSEQITKINDLKNENENLSEINQKNEQIIQQLQQTLKQAQQFSQSLTFSTIYKHNNCSVTQNGKVIQTKISGWQCCMCDQMIPKNDMIQFAVKIIEIGDIMIGIGFQGQCVEQRVSKLFYTNRTYNIYHNGQCYNHDQQDKNEKSIAFPFSTNDIIIVEVDIQKKYVKWKKQFTNQSFVSNSIYYQSLTIDTSKDLYPCVHLYGTCKVEILNQVFK